MTTAVGSRRRERRAGLRDRRSVGHAGALARPIDAAERTILSLRFDHDLTQSEIAARLGCSQMHVSRRPAGRAISRPAAGHRGLVHGDRRYLTSRSRTRRAGVHGPPRLLRRDAERADPPPSRRRRDRGAHRTVGVGARRSPPVRVPPSGARAPAPRGTPRPDRARVERLSRFAGGVDRDAER